jgi:hypothetical protein
MLTIIMIECRPGKGENAMYRPRQNDRVSWWALVPETRALIKISMHDLMADRIRLLIIKTCYNPFHSPFGLFFDTNKYTVTLEF